MKRMVQTYVLICAMLFSVNAFAFTASYVQITSGDNLPKSDRRLVKMKDNKIRMEMKSPQGEDVVVILDGSAMYSYVPSRNEAYRMQSAMSHDMSVMSDYESYLRSLDADIVGSEKVGSYDCDVYEFTDPRINADSRVWLWKSKNFPVKVEIDMRGSTMTTEMEDVKIGLPIADSEFVIPDSVEIIETTGTR